MASITDSLALIGDLSVPFAPGSAGLLADAELLDGRPDDDGILRHTPLPSRSPAHDRLLAG